MQEPTARHSYVQLNGSFVHLVHYSAGASPLRWPTSPKTSASTLGNTSKSPSGPTSSSSGVADRLVVFVPGNPGMLGVYHDYLAALFRAVNGSPNSGGADVLAISHNNFDHPDSVQYKAEERTCLDENDLNFVEQSLVKNHLKDPHCVELQVLNKLIILKRLLHLELDKRKLVFVGHSIGCYIILRLLQDSVVASCHLGSILVHPALENMVLTEKGKRISRMFEYRMDLLAHSVALAIDWLLPESAKKALVRWTCRPEFLARSSDVVIESIGQLVTKKSLTALIDMAKSEFRLVRNLDIESMVRPHVPRLKLIYAIDDHWVNTNHRRVLAERYPELHIEEQPTLHAFMMDPETAIIYAAKVAKFVQDFLEAGASGAR